ncbi:GAF domain-containing protein [Alicycliphilus denitrificans]|uniref:GAF domain-containing protein n=1 Tax=Alicycliphilus denitrificans TaxID=179636 RepID=A0A3R7H2V5_9BURK|nr:GAF domain-containing protein [Alicycliphilus denitrificans]RKJ98239.1 GAF domain-containing protein [Alicycliphilus denitrificans]HRO82969.1 GAF domain-containing protein [Alicycliphilus denitrificans]
MSDAPTLRSIRACLEGAIPAIMATCAPDGTPNVAYISQVLYVDERHVALSFQFFNKTRANILANPHANVLVLDPVTARFYRLHLRYLHTETSGALFERMRAQLAGIASHSGMDGIFELKGADLHAVERIEPVPGEGLAPGPGQLPRADLLGAVRLCSQRLARCTSLDELLQALLAGLHAHLGVQHAMVLMLDAQAGHLYTVASHGYAHSGVGSEIKLGQGVIGVAAREATPVRISHMTHAALYSHAMRSSLGQGGAPAHEIPYPGLAAPHSQLAVPLVSCGRTLGVLFVESPLDLQFRYPEEDALAALAGHLAAAIDLLQAADEAGETPPAEAAATAPQGLPVRVRHFAVNDSVFVNDAYLIKGVAGAIIWKLLRDHVRTGRQEFSNRELRLDPCLRLPDVADNLEARLLLLQRRLQESDTGIHIDKTGRGRLRLRLDAPVRLDEMQA